MSVGITSSLISAFPSGMEALDGASSQNESSGGGFGDVLKSAVSRVSDLQNSADTQVNSLMQSGQGDMGQTMISVEKADVAFQLMMQVRNKVVSAYQDIEKMQF